MEQNSNINLNFTLWHTFNVKIVMKKVLYLPKVWNINLRRAVRKKSGKIGTFSHEEQSHFLGEIYSKLKKNFADK